MYRTPNTADCIPIIHAFLGFVNEIGVENTGLFLFVVGGAHKKNKIAEKVNSDRNKNFPNYRVRGTHEKSVENGGEKPKDDED